MTTRNKQEPISTAMTGEIGNRTADNGRRTMNKLVVVMFMLMLPAVVQAQFNYTTNADNTITITGYTGLGGAVTIQDTINGLQVSRIGTNAFYGSTSLTSVTVPDSVTSIGNYAFNFCSRLINATIGNGVTNIGAVAFYRCSLTNVTMGTNVTSIGNSAFAQCKSLASITIPAKITSIGMQAFYSCSGLTAITVDTNNSVYSSVDGVLFNKSQTRLIKCPDAKVGHYIVPNSVTTINGQNDGFNYCILLTSVSIPMSVTTIPDYGFYGCRSLTNFTVSSSITTIGSFAFSYCTALASIVVDSNNSVYSSLDGVLFNRNQTLLLAYPGGKAGSYTISSNVTTIGRAAFCGCSGLASLTVPVSVINIEDFSFSGCADLTALYFKGNAPTLGTSVFTGDNKATIYYLSGKTSWTNPWGGRPTVLWNPHAQSDATFRVQTNGFGFTISGSSNLVIVTEACTSLSNQVWLPLGTNTLTGGSSYFSDPGWKNYPSRFYRFRSE